MLSPCGRYNVRTTPPTSWYETLFSGEAQNSTLARESWPMLVISELVWSHNMSVISQGNYLKFENLRLNFLAPDFLSSGLRCSRSKGPTTSGVPYVPVPTLLHNLLTVLVSCVLLEAYWLYYLVSCVLLNWNCPDAKLPNRQTGNFCWQQRQGYGRAACHFIPLWPWPRSVCGHPFHSNARRAEHVQCWVVSLIFDTSRPDSVRNRRLG